MKVKYLLVLVVALTSSIFALKMKKKQVTPSSDYTIGSVLPFPDKLICNLIRSSKLGSFNEEGKSLTECYNCTDYENTNCMEVISYEN